MSIFSNVVRKLLLDGYFYEWMFLAGLGIFLFGIYLMEESIKLISGSTFKSIIRRYLKAARQ